MIQLSAPLDEIKGIGPKFFERLSKFGLRTVKDLLWHFPFRYEDFSEIKKIADLKVNERATIQGVIAAVKLKRTWRRRMFIVEALISDDTGSIRAVWFNQKFLLSILKKGKLLNLAGKVVSDPDSGLALSHPIYELTTSQTNADDTQTYPAANQTRYGAGAEENQCESALSQRESALRHTGRLVPIYPETRKITSRALRYLIKPTLEKLERLDDPIPQEILKGHNFPEVNLALNQIHFPETIRQVQVAKKRFAFEDLFFLQLANLRQRMKLVKERAYSVKVDIEYVKALLSELPFELTKSQKKALWEILKDLSRSHPMNRLLQGDVGSGKTIVAALSVVVVAQNGFQSAFVAPTEVLVRQHFNTLKTLFRAFEQNINLGFIVSGEAKIFYGDDLESDVKKGQLLKSIEENKIQVVIGTHALIQKSVKFGSLGLVIIDEQHRFGVAQRAMLMKNASGGHIPNFLSMSATPIPRTLTLTIFGDLDLSIIDELPKGRKEIITKIVAPANRDKAYAFIHGQVKKGRQVFVICPRIEKSEMADMSSKDAVVSLQRGETPLDSRSRSAAFGGNHARSASETLSQTYPPSRKSFLWENVKMVKEEYEKLSKKVFPDLRVAMLHGKLKVKEKSEIMKKFASGEIDILVSTSVIEVGVDIPNATIMMIEGADRFGLAQLYQFRGRVGRGEHQSFCFLFTDSPAKTTYKRLHSLLEARTGFELAEKDLEIRGPGEFLGESQTGLPDLAMKAVQNPELVRVARSAAESVLKADPSLKNHPLLRKRLESFEKEVHLE